MRAGRSRFDTGIFRRCISGGHGGPWPLVARLYALRCGRTRLIRFVRDLPGATHLIPGDLDGDRFPDLLFCRGHERGIGWLKGPAWAQEHVLDAGWIENPHAFAAAHSFHSRTVTGYLPMAKGLIAV